MTLRAACLVLAALFFGSSSPAMAADPPVIRPMVNGRAIYKVVTTQDAARYIDSDIYRTDDRPQLEAHLLDQAISETDAGIVHTPTKLSFPKRFEACTLTSLSGLYTPLGFTFARGGLGTYRCEPSSGVSVIILSFEADARLGLRGEALGRRLLTGSMMGLLKPSDLTCTRTKARQRLELRCSRQALLDSELIEERGVVIVHGGDTFLKVVYPCIQADCARATVQVDRLVALVSAPTALGSE